MKMIAGAFFLAAAKSSLTRLAETLVSKGTRRRNTLDPATPYPPPTPTNISSKLLPLAKRNGTSASPATARASIVLPVPGGPVRSTPLGSFPPSVENFSGFRKNSTSSSSSYTRHK
jgi:hypothetical protein